MAKQEEQKGVKLPVFEAAPQCPKCKTKKLALKHSAVPTDGCGVLTSTDLNASTSRVRLQEREFLQAICQTCGYWWLMACADRPEPEAKP